MFFVLNKSTIFVKSLISQSVCLMQWKELFFGGRWRDPCNLSGIQFARKFMKLNNFICLTYHLSNNLKIYHKFSPTIYTNQMFWFHLCYMHSSCSYDPLNKIMCFVLLNFTKVYSWLCMGNALADNVAFILMKFRNTQKYSNWKYSSCTFRTLDNALLYVQNLSYFELFESLNLSSLCCCTIKITKKLLIVYRNKKNSTYDQDLY